MKLFDHPLSPYAFKVRATLYEKGIDFEKHEIWREDQRAELLRLNPRAEVPALEDADTVLFDSRVICDYLEETHPSPPLLPSKAAARGKCRALELVCDTQVDACVYVIALVKVFRPGLEAQFPRVLAEATETLQKHYDNFDAALGTQEYFTGAFSRADIALFPHITAAVFMGYPISDKQPNLAKWMSRASQRPSLQRASQEAMAAFEQSQKDTDPFFDRNRLHWRSDRIEMAVRVGLGQWLLEDLAAGRAFLPPVP